MPGFLGSQHAFQRGVVKPIRDGDGESLEYLRSRVKPFILRRTKAEVAKDLPPKIESVTYCNMTDEQAELYTALTRSLIHIFPRFLTGGGLRGGRSVGEGMLLRIAC